MIKIDPCDNPIRIDSVHCMSISAKCLIVLISLSLIPASCSGPVPMSQVIRPEDDAAYLERLNTENHDGRIAYLKWKAEETGRSIDDLKEEDKAFSRTRNPFDAYTDSVALSRGAVLYKYHCARCHGDDVRGNGPAVLPGYPAKDFHDFGQRFASTLHRGAPRSWFKKITQGYGDQVNYPDEPIGPAMPAFGDKLTREQIWLLITYLQSLDARLPDASKRVATE
jgi:mono/diheme cytochrome c family protein